MRAQRMGSARGSGMCISWLTSVLCISPGRSQGTGATRTVAEATQTGGTTDAARAHAIVVSVTDATTATDATTGATVIATATVIGGTRRAIATAIGTATGATTTATATAGTAIVTGEHVAR